MGTKTDAARKWRNERTFEILISKFSPNYMLYILGLTHFFGFWPFSKICPCESY